MQKSRKVWKNGVSFLIVFVLAFTSVFFNLETLKAAIKPDQVNSGANLKMTLVDITGGKYNEEPAENPLELVTGEKYTLKVRLGYQDEDGTGLSKLLITVKNGEIKVYRNGIEKTHFSKLVTSSLNQTSTDVEFDFLAGEGSTPDENGKINDYIVAKGKTGIVNHEIILSSYLVYNLKLKADFYYDGADKPSHTQIVNWNNKVTKIQPEKKDGYKFKGWYYRNKQTTEFNFDEPIKDNVELVAKYEVENEESQPENKIEEVKVKFIADNREQEVKVDKGSTFEAAKTKKQEEFNLAEENAKKYNVSNGNINVDKYDWYEDSAFQKKADDSEKIEKDRTYYGQLKKEKVNVTFRVGDIDKEKVTIEKGQTFNDAKKAVTFNISEYEWFEDEAFDIPAVVDKQILENKIYFGKLKATANNGNNDNNGDNNNNNNNGNNGDNNNNNNANNGNNNNNSNNNNNGNTTPVVPTVPTVPNNNITIPDETTPLSPTTPDTEDKDTNDNINIEDDDTALGTAVIDDKSEDEDATVPVKDGKKATANEDNSVDIASEDTPLGTTLPKTGGSLGITYILLGLLISVLGIKKFREK